MDKPLKISIITPSYNQGRFIADAIDSVASQNYPNIEHIILDAQSNDETLEVLSRYSHLPHLTWVSEPDKGQTDAINKGFRRATGDVVAWLNADDYYLPGAFARVNEVFSEQPNTDILYGEAAFVDEHKNVTGYRRGHTFDYHILLYFGCYIQSTATFFRRHIVDHEHLLEPSYKTVMDYEYYVRLATLGYQFGFIPEVLAAFRWHGTNISAVHADLRRQERRKVIRQYGIHLPNELLESALYKTAYRAFRLKRFGRMVLEGRLQNRFSLFRT
jgi:glycosyltransferase involved in cell wall biosynthesis